MKKKILYLMHVDWNWIKQRPHFLAEGLAEHYEVDVRYAPAKKKARKNLSVNGTPSGLNGLKIGKLIRLPLSGRSPLVRRLQKWLNGLLCSFSRHDILWICAPEILYRVSLKGTENMRIVYDCMDDMHGTQSVSQYREELQAMEREVIRAAEIIFVSSDSLRAKMLERGASKGQLATVYNATSLTSLRARAPAPQAKEGFTLTYFGTISGWIDIAILMRLLDDKELPGLRVKMIGPSETPLPSHERLVRIGPVRHAELAGQVGDNDLFILPFLLNPITLSVDPVKLYEYIAFGGNIAARFYPELTRYSEFVHFYDDYDGLKGIVLKLMRENSLKYPSQRAEEFLAANTWDKRVSRIVERLEGISSFGAGPSGGTP